MKRSALLRRTPLSRTARPKARPKPVSRNDPARIEWKTSRGGYCECGCARFSLHLEHHHVLAAERLRVEGREDVLWDPRNGMYLDPVCHARHTLAARRIRLERVPAPAVAFMIEVLGEERAADYLDRYYRCDRTAA